MGGGKKGRKQERDEEEPEVEEEEEINEEMIKQQLARLMDPNFAENTIQKLPLAIRNRVFALEGLQKKHDEIREKFVEEHKAIERKFEELYRPFYEQRLAILSGKHEPTDEEAKKGIPDDYKDDASANQEPAGATGIPGFWLRVLQNNGLTADMIQERDEECLKYLTNIVAKNFEDPDQGFTLEFHFASNPFFENEILLKTYHLLAEEEIVLDKAEGCDINWKSGQNLTVVIKKKKEVKKGSKGKSVSKVVTKEQPCDSFFNFFKPPQPPQGEDEEDYEEEDPIEEMIEADYEIGQTIKDRIIPRAVLWYTGELNDLFDDDDDYDEEDEEDEEDDDDDDDDDRPPARQQKKGGGGKDQPKSKGPAPGGKGGQQPPECKQQ